MLKSSFKNLVFKVTDWPRLATAFATVFICASYTCRTMALPASMVLPSLYVSHVCLVREMPSWWLLSHTISFPLVSLLSVQIEIRVLDLSNNQISAIEGIDTLVHLQEFWVSPYTLFTTFFVCNSDARVLHVKSSLLYV